MTDVFSDHFSIVYDICRAACHGDTVLGRSSVKKLASLIESSTPDDAALLKRLTKKAAKNPANFVQTALTDEQREDLQEAREILENMVCSVELDGNYSTEATCTFLRQALLCIPKLGAGDAALTAAQSASGDTK